jgi:signal peptidase I
MNGGRFSGLITFEWNSRLSSREGDRMLPAQSKSMTLQLIRKGLAAFLLSIVTPGLGQVYNGQLLKGIFGLGGLLGLLLLSTAVGLTHTFNGLIIHNILLLSAYVFLLGEAVFTAVWQVRLGQRSTHTWRSYLVGLSLLLITVFALSSSVPDRIPGVRAYKMVANSMSPTLDSEDRIVADMKYYRSHAPQRGDLIVFQFPYQDHPVYIKRIIGVPGDRVKIVDKQVYVNGQRISELYIVHDPAAPFDPFGDNFPPHSPEYLQANMQPEWADEIFKYIHDGEITVPPGKYFAMGDNRDHSWDSRYWGPIARDKIIGKGLYIYWSKDKSRIGQTIR